MQLAGDNIMPKDFSISQYFFDKIIIKYPKTILVFILILVSFLLFQTKNFRLDASAENLLLENDK
jgi:predicted RND superfamily exporter protein